MARPVLHFLIIAYSVVSISSYIRVVDAAPISTCSQTPYPQLCNYKPTTGNDDETDHQFSFRDTVLRFTMNQAERLYSDLVSAMDLSSSGDRTELACSDCLELYENIIDLLNLSINSITPAAMYDSQTWLSAALANQQTCLNGFTDSDHFQSFFPSLSISSANFSKLLSNSLAINKAAVSGAGGRRLLDNAFPTWVSPADRKLLGAAPRADFVVANDGSGDYRTISEAVAESVKLRNGTDKRFVIYVKAGVYRENVEIKRRMKNIMMLGDGKDATIVTGNKNVRDGSTTFRSATFGVSGYGFIAQDMTFENTAGPEKHQAVALRSSSDGSVFYRCSFKGYQDTLYVHTHRQFYRNCDIYGTVDFIFGDAVVVLQNCDIYVRKPIRDQANTITAQGRSDPNENTGISIHNSRVMAASDLRPVQSRFKTYLGRPWREYSRTVFLKTFLDGLIHPEGWHAWNGEFALGTLYYGEYMNTGSGASTYGRVKWGGYHVIGSAAEADKFTVRRFLAGDSWIPTTGVPYASGL